MHTHTKRVEIIIYGNFPTENTGLLGVILAVAQGKDYSENIMIAIAPACVVKHVVGGHDDPKSRDFHFIHVFAIGCHFPDAVYLQKEIKRHLGVDMPVSVYHDEHHDKHHHHDG